MSISYPLTLPTTSGIARISLQYRCVNSLLASPWTGDIQIQETDNDGWIADISIPVMDADEAAAWRAFLAALRGRYGTFLIGDPIHTSPRGLGTGSPMVDGLAQSGYALSTKGWPASTDGCLLAGDYFCLGNRLHMAVEDVDSDADGKATFDIRPKLRESPGDSNALSLTNCKGLFRLADDTVTILETYGDDLSYPITFAAIEAV